MICIECSSEFPENQKIKPYCVFCRKKVDKYFEANNVYKVIDLLLFKKKVFLHFLINTKPYFRDTLLHIIFFIFSNFIVVFYKPRFSVLELFSYKFIFSDLYFINIGVQLLDLIFYCFFIKLFFYKIPFYILLRCIVISSFYSGFKVLFAFWTADLLVNLIVVDILNIVGNSLALNCIKKNDNQYIFVFVIFKVMSKAFAIFFYQKIFTL